jgi:hypothetical protein
MLATLISVASASAASIWTRRHVCEPHCLHLQYTYVVGNAVKCKVCGRVFVSVDSLLHNRKCDK